MDHEISRATNSSNKYIGIVILNCDTPGPHMNEYVKYCFALLLFMLLCRLTIAGNDAGTPSTTCAQAHVKELVFRVENHSFRISGQTKVRTVYNTLAKTFPDHADNLALALEKKTGWFHVSKRMQDTKLADELFLCALYRKFGVQVPPNASFSLVKNFEKPNIAIATLKPAISSLQPFFEKLRKDIPAPPKPQKGTTSFSLTTEIEIGKIRNLMSNAPHGLYVTLGGDRAFRGAALLEGISGLLIFDIDTRTVRFNQINARLLKAKSLVHYRHLRWDAPFSEWQLVDNSLTADDYNYFRRQVATDDIDGHMLVLSEKLNRYQSDLISQRFSNLHLEITKGINLSDHDRAWYTKISSQNPCAQLFLNDTSKHFLNASSYIRYQEGNYLFDEKLFLRLRNLAIHNKIFSVAAQLADYGTQDAIIAAFKEYNVKISILDLDNGYLSSYLGSEPYDRLIKGLLPFGDHESRLLAMANMRTAKSRYKDNQACSHTHFNVYIGFTFDYIHKLPQKFTEHMMIDIFRKSKDEFLKNNWQDIKLFR